MSDQQPSATLRVTFGQPSAGRGANYLSAEIDGREDGPNGGNTQFTPGGKVWFLVHRGANVSIDGVEASAGTVLLGSDITYIKEEEVVFGGEKTTSLSMPSEGIVSTKWIGRNLGVITMHADKQTIEVPAEGVGVAKIRHTVKAKQGSLQSPSVIDGETDFSIAVIITGTVTGG
jgi:hypothetical protein